MNVAAEKGSSGEVKCAEQNSGCQKEQGRRTGFSLLLSFTDSTVCVGSAIKKKHSLLMFNVINGRVIQLVHVAERASTQLHDYADVPFFFFHVS